MVEKQTSTRVNQRNFVVVVGIVDRRNGVVATEKVLFPYNSLGGQGV